MPIPASPVHYLYAHRFTVSIQGEALALTGAKVTDTPEGRLVTLSCALRLNDQGHPAPRLAPYADTRKRWSIKVTALDKQGQPAATWSCIHATTQTYTPCAFASDSADLVHEELVLLGEEAPVQEVQHGR